MNQSIKIFFYLIVSILLTNCKSDKKELISGYYIDNQNLEIYCFKGNELNHYNVLDSIHQTLPFKVDEESILFDYQKYSYKKYDNDSLILMNYTINNEKTHLIKFNYEDLDLKELFSFEFELDSKEDLNNDAEFYIRFNSDNISLFGKDKGELYSHYFSENDYLGKYFGKFHFFDRSNSIHILLLEKYNNKEVSCMTYDYDKKIFFKIKLKKMTLDKKSLLIGTWNIVSDEERNNLLQSFNYAKVNLYDIKMTKEQRSDSIKSIINFFQSITFTKDSLFIGIKGSQVLNKKKSTLRYLYDYNPSSNIVSLNHTNYDNPYVIIEKFTIDSLIISPIEFYPFKFLYTRK